jgi:hypothetical protein
MRLSITSISLTLIVFAAIGCAHRPITETRTADKPLNPATASQDAREAPKEHTHTPWIYNHIRHRDTRPAYKGQKPAIPTGNCPACKTNQQPKAEPEVKM